jgi:hypothetical protein
VEVHFSCISLPRVMPYGNSTIDSNSRITSEAQALNTLVVGLNSPSWCGGERRRTPKNRGGLSIYNASEPICDWTSSSDLVRPLLPKAIGSRQLLLEVSSGTKIATSVDHGKILDALALLGDIRRV